MERVRTVITRIKILLEFVKFEHTLFALPFAYLGAILAKEGMPSPRSSSAQLSPIGWLGAVVSVTHLGRAGGISAP